MLENQNNQIFESAHNLRRRSIRPHHDMTYWRLTAGSYYKTSLCQTLSIQAVPGQRRENFLVPESINAINADQSLEQRSQSVIPFMYFIQHSLCIQAMMYN